MMNNLRHAFRSLARTPGFTVVAILTLALGIGMNTAMFSILNGFLLRPLSFPHSEQLFRLDRTLPEQPRGSHPPANFDDIVRDSASFAELAAVRFWAFTVSEPNQPADVPNAMRVSSNYFNVLGVQPELGRTFFSDEDAPGKDNVIILSHRYWQSRFAGARNIIGRTIRLDGLPVEIVGVMPPDEDTIRILGDVGIYRPLGLKNEERALRTDASLAVIGRYRDGVTSEQALTQFNAIAARLAFDHAVANRDAGLGIRSLQSTTLTGVGLSVTWMLVGLSSFVLLIACANLANLLLARALSRIREYSIRGALGASRIQLIKPIVVECLLLATFGASAAMLVSMWTTDWLSTRFATPDNPANFAPDLRVLSFALAASLLTALVFGVGPAWWAARTDLNDTLKSGSRGAGGSRSQTRYRHFLIVTQFALALVLLAGAGFFLRGLEKLMGSHTGWNPDPVVSGVVNLASSNYSGAEPIIAFHTQLRNRLLALPGVENAAVCFEIPLFNPPPQRAYLVEGREPPPPGQESVAFTNGVSASFLDTVGLNLLRGRFIDDTDQLTSRPVVVINKSMARVLFPGEDAIGRRIGVAGNGVPPWAEIVGVVDDTRAMNLAPSPIRFQVYKPFTQEAWQYVTIAIRASNSSITETLIEPIRRTVAALDADQPVLRLMPVPNRIDQNFAVWKTINLLLVLFATLGLLLAALGIYGVITRLVTQRTSEIGIRLALGAQVRDILRLIMGNGLRMALAGAGVGLVGAVLAIRYLSRALPAFDSNGLLPIFESCALLILVAVVACLLPARRATKVDPVTALRAE